MYQYFEFSICHTKLKCACISLQLNVKLQVRLQILVEDIIAEHEDH